MNRQRTVLLAAVAGLVTGVIALVGHFTTTLLHAVGGSAALVLVTVVAHHARRRSLSLLVGAMALATATGVAWTVLGATDLVVIAHVVTGVLASAGALVLALD